MGVLSRLAMLFDTFASRNLAEKEADNGGGVTAVAGGGWGEGAGIALMD
jgi:hypothetical protein